MWDHISDVGKAIRKYRHGIAVGACSMIVLPLCVSCGDSLNMAGPGQPYSWLTDEEKAADARRPRINVNSDSGYWKTEHEIEKLERLNRELEFENSMRIRGMQLELKRREAERKLQEFNRQYNR